MSQQTPAPNLSNLIRSGILHCPVMDEAAGDVLRRFLLAEDGPTGASYRFVFIHESYVGNDKNWIEDVLVRWCDEEELDLILTVGGSMAAPGPSRRELMPDATHAVLERLLPGLPEAMRAHAGELSELALMERGVAGIRGRTLLVNLPAGAAPARCFLEAIAHLLGPIVSHLQESPTAPRLQDELELEEDAGQRLGAGQQAGKSEREKNEEEEADKEGGSDEEQEGKPGKLDADEFAAFLRRKK